MHGEARLPGGSQTEAAARSPGKGEGAGSGGQSAPSTPQVNAPAWSGPVSGAEDELHQRDPWATARVQMQTDAAENPALKRKIGESGAAAVYGTDSGLAELDRNIARDTREEVLRGLDSSLGEVFARQMGRHAAMLEER